MNSSTNVTGTGPIAGDQHLAVPRSSSTRSSSSRVLMRFQVSALLLDLLSVFVSFWGAYELRYTYRIGALVPIGQDTLEFSQWARHAFLTSIVAIGVFWGRGAYRADRRLTPAKYISRVVTSYPIAISIVILVAFFVQFSPSRLVYGYALVIGTALMLTHRLIAEIVKGKLYERGLGIDRAVVAGHSENARRLTQSLAGQTWRGYKLIGVFASSSDTAPINVATGSGIRTVQALGDLQSLEAFLSDHIVDDLFIVEADHSPDEIENAIDACRSFGVRFWIVPSLLQLSIDRAHVSDINGIPMLGVSDASIMGWDAFFKRAIDLVVSTTLIVVAAIPFLFVAVLIRLDSSGPIFYRQTRMGRGGAKFQMIKFRTMVANADDLRQSAMERSSSDQRLFKDARDPRITRVGAVLRKFSIDELPQTLNVFRGEMSLVGPRPPLPSEVESYESWHMQRLLVRPGMTGLWQVSGRSDLTFDQMVRLDLYYAENWSGGLDFSILLRTLPAVVLGKGAY